jgi:hypothetical protein
MLDLTWKLFCMTGSIDSYLLIRDMEREHTEPETEKPDVQERTD